MGYGNEIRNRRIALELTQIQLGDAIGKSHKRISDYENENTVPDPETLRKLQAVLGWFGKITKRPILPTLKKHLIKLRLYVRKGERTTAHRLRTAVKRWPALAPIVNQLTQRQWALLQYYACDSCWEAAVMALLIVIGRAKLVMSRPLVEGFFEHVVLHPTDERPAGHIRFPALVLVWKGRRMIFFPQVPVQTTGCPFTLDFLVGVRRKGGPRWLDMEIDGTAHDGTGDDYRGGLISLKALRFVPKDICATDFVEKLLDAVLAEVEAPANTKLTQSIAINPFTDSSVSSASAE